MADVLEVNSGPGVVSPSAPLAPSGSSPKETTRDDGAKGPAALLIVLGDVHSPAERDLALQRVVDGLSSFDSEKCGCDLEEELKSVMKQSPKENSYPGETVFEYKSEFLHVDILVNPRSEVVQKTLCSFLLTNSCYRFLLYSGLTLQNSGGWFLQDGYFGYSSVSDVFLKPEVLRSLSAQSGSQLDVSLVSEVGEWTPVGVSKLSSHLTVRLNPPKLERKADSISALSSFLSAFLKTPSSVDLLVSTTTFGNFSQTLPTLHIFPGGQGDSALFSLSGLNLLFGGGYIRRSCFWDIVRHLPSLDAVVLSHFGPDNLFGFESFLEKKVEANGFPDIGAIFLNTPKTKSIPPAEKTSSLLVNLSDRAAQIFDNLHHISAVVLPCLGSVHNQTLLPIPLYHKVGHGSIDLYVLNPLADNKETKDLLSSWTKNLGGHKSGIPILDYASLCSLLVWKSISASEKSVRILFPGNTPQAKIFEGLDRLKTVGIFQNMSGRVEKGVGGATKTAAPCGKTPLVGKVKPPTGAKQENKDISKPTTEHKGIPEQSKDVKKGTDHQREPKKSAGEIKDGKKPQTGGKNLKTPSTTLKKDVAATGIPSAMKIIKKRDGDNLTKKPEQTASATEVEVNKTEATEETGKKDADEAAAAFPVEVEPAEPSDSHPTAMDDLSQVQALPPPDLRVEELEAEKGILEEEEQEDRGMNKGSPNALESNEGFDPSKEWGIPEGLPAPVNGKDLGAAKKLGLSTSVAAANKSKKVGDASKATETSKTGAKRPTTAPDRLNNTTRGDGVENGEKPAANQSLARGRPSIAGIGSARGDSKKLPSKPVVPFYVDVAYIPAHGSLTHFDLDFFRRVRARYYVLSSIAPNPKVLVLLVEGKLTWDDPTIEVTVIPTYGSDSLIEWIGENQDQLQKLNIKVAAPASKCTVQLQETACASYRLEL